MIGFRNKKILLIILVVVVALILFFISKRGNGGWICENGIWVSQGKPSKPRPLYSCDNKKEQKESTNEEEDDGSLVNESNKSEVELLSGDDTSGDSSQNEKEIVGDDIRISGLGVGDIINSPIKIAGSAKGWYFEGSFGVQVIGESDEVLFDGLAQAQGDWMQDDYVPFVVDLNFETKGLERGKIIFKKSNPSGLEENEKELSFLILFR